MNAETAADLQAMAERRRLKLVVFGFDAAEAAQIRRIQSYIDCGFDVTAFTMRRGNMNRDFEPFWNNVHLYDVKNADMAGRLRAIAGSIVKVRRHRDALEGADVIVARNLDMLAIAASAQSMTRPRAPLVYECLDIHGLMTNAGPKGRVFRALERRLLSRVSALIVSSPAFLTEYFTPVQGWTGPAVLLENKVWIGADGPPRPAVPVRATRSPLVLGWVGTLRCRDSLMILADTAKRLGPKLRVELHGIVHDHAIPDFDEIVAAHDNIVFKGPYDYPDGLAPVYAGCDMVWSQDLWQWGTNSTWLLPNRIYEASYFGCPSIAVDGTETGRRVADGLGWTVPEPSAEALTALIQKLTPGEVQAKRQDLLAMPEGLFRQSLAEIRTAITAPLGAAPIPA